MLALLRSIAFAASAAMATVLLLAPLPAAAQSQDLPDQIALTPPMVEGFLASYPELEALGQELEQKYGQSQADPEDPSSVVTGFAQYADARAKMEEIIRKNGIASLKDWVHIAYSVMLAYSFSERGEGGSVDDEMAQAMQQIRNDKNIPAEQKDQLIKMLEEQMAQISQLRPPPGNIEVVARYKDRVREIAETSQPSE